MTITRQEHIDLKWRAGYWETQHARVKSQLEEVRQDNLVKDAKIKDLQNRLFGKKSEKDSPLKSEKDGPDDSQPKRKRGQQPGSAGHGRTKRPDLPVVDDEIDLADAAKCCPSCGLPHLPNPALDEHSNVIPQRLLQRVREKSQSRLWNKLIERYHDLGHKPLPGARLRYLVYASDQPVALLGFGAAVWMSAPRDRYIGWSHE